MTNHCVIFHPICCVLNNSSSRFSFLFLSYQTPFHPEALSSFSGISNASFIVMKLQFIHGDWLLRLYITSMLPYPELLFLLGLHIILMVTYSKLFFPLIWVENSFALSFVCFFQQILCLIFCFLSQQSPLLLMLSLLWAANLPCRTNPWHCTPWDLLCQWGQKFGSLSVVACLYESQDEGLATLSCEEVDLWFGLSAFLLFFVQRSDVALACTLPCTEAICWFGLCPT